MTTGTEKRPLLQGPAAVGLAAAFYVAWTVLTTWPLVLRLDAIPHDLGDPLLNAWLIWWDSHVLPLTDRWWNAPMFVPTAGATAFSEHLLGLAVLGAPIVRLSGSLPLGYNVLFLLSFVLCALAAYALCFTIVRRHDAAFVAGLAYAFAPYRWNELAHLQMLSSYWLPVSLLALHRYVDDRGTRWAVLFAIAWLMQALSCGYFLFYGSVLAGLWLLWFGAGRLTTRDLLRLGAAWGVAALALAPVIYNYKHYQGLYGFSRSLGEIEHYSADVVSLLKASAQLRFWGWVNVYDRPEAALFPGLAVPVLLLVASVAARSRLSATPLPRIKAARWLVVVAAVFLAVSLAAVLGGSRQLTIGGVRLLSIGSPFKPFTVAILCLAATALAHPALRGAWRRRSAFAGYLVAAAVMWIFSLGPTPTFMGSRLMYKAPYAWLMLLPGIEGVRVPARFWMLAVLCLSCAAGIAVARLSARWPRARLGLAGAACLGILFDGWPAPVPMLTPPAWQPSHTDAAQRLDLPIERWHDISALYRSAQHQRPLVNGFSGYFPAHYWALTRALDRFDAGALTVLLKQGSLEVVVDHEGDQAGEWRKFVAAYPGARTVHTDEHYTSFRIDPPAPAAVTSTVLATRLDVQSVTASVNGGAAGRMTDGDNGTRWDSSHPQRPGDSVTVDLGAAKEVVLVELLLGRDVTDYPRELRIETSLDGQTWHQNWAGGVAVIAVAGGLDSPREFPLRFPLTPESARYLRLTQTAEDTTYYWSIGEIRVTGR